MRKKGALPLIVCSFVLILTVSSGASGVTGAMFYESIMKPFIHGLGG